MKQSPHERFARPLQRRELLRLAGGGVGMLAFAAAVRRGRSKDLFGVRAARAETSCELTPEQTEGPYYLEDALVHRNVAEGRPGAPLWLTLRVTDASACAPIPGAIVEIWHADANGNYSGYNGFEGQTFMRGQQVVGDAGVATFRTVYPGWYTGRTVHIHVKAHVGGNTVHTSQLYFDDAFTDAVYTRSPYAERGTRDTRNANDGIYANGGAASLLTVAARGKGYWGSIRLVVADA